MEEILLFLTSTIKQIYLKELEQMNKKIVNNRSSILFIKNKKSNSYLK